MIHFPIAAVQKSSDNEDSSPSPASSAESLIVLDARDELHHILSSDEDEGFPDEFVFCGVPEEEIEVDSVRKEQAAEEEEELVLRSCPSFTHYGKCYNSQCKMVHFKPDVFHWEDSTSPQEEDPNAPYIIPVNNPYVIFISRPQQYCHPSPYPQTENDSYPTNYYAPQYGQPCHNHTVNGG